MEGLGDLPDGSFESFAFDVSGDGSTVVGYGNNASGHPRAGDGVAAGRRADRTEGRGAKEGDVGSASVRVARAYDFCGSSPRFVRSVTSSSTSSWISFSRDSGSTLLTSAV